MKTVCLLAQKGGTGKTTLCLHLAVLAGELGHDAAVVDIDPQASASAWRRRRASTKPEVMRREASELPEALAGLLPDEETVLGMLDPVEPQQLDELAERAPFSFARLQTALFGLELRGAIDTLPGRRYTLADRRRSSPR